MHCLKALFSTSLSSKKRAIKTIVIKTEVVVSQDEIMYRGTGDNSVETFDEKGNNGSQEHCDNLTAKRIRAFGVYVVKDFDP